MASRSVVVSLCAMLAASFIQAHASAFTGKLWILSNANGPPATLPPPSSTPDATFTTNHLSIMMDAPPDVNVNNSVKGFLDSAAPVQNLTFSGLVNPVLGTVVKGSTRVVDSTASNCSGSYGVYIEFTGSVRLSQNERVTVTHDDAVSMTIDGVNVQGLQTSTNAISNQFIFAGSTGVHSIDIAYVNTCGYGLFSFSPKM